MRAIAFDRAGATVAQHAVAVAAPARRAPGWAEYEPAYLWERFCRACNELWQAADCRDAIGAVAVTTVRSSVVALDDAGAPLYPLIHWSDRRRLERAPRLGGLTGAAMQLAGAGATIAALQCEAEANWLALNEPRLWQRCAKFLLLSGYLHYRLTGAYRDAAAAQIGYVPLDFRRARWAGPRSWKWRALPLRRAQLPELVDPGDRIGTVSTPAAQATGLPAGLPVIAAAADKACEVLGAGADRSAVACLSLGTAATVNVSSTRYTGPARFLPPYPAARPGRWNIEAQVSEGFARVSWFRDHYASGHLRAAAVAGVAPESLLDRLLGQSSPGAAGLLAPPSQPATHAETEPVFVGLREDHTDADRYRALIEGVLFALRDGLERIEARSGGLTRRLRAAGGGAGSATILQMASDLFGLPAARVQTPECSALGAAINAAVGCGWYPDHAAAVAAMVHAQPQRKPDPDLALAYEQLYRERFLPAYRGAETPGDGPARA